MYETDIMLSEIDKVSLRPYKNGQDRSVALFIASILNRCLHKAASIFCYLYTIPGSTEAGFEPLPNKR